MSTIPLLLLTGFLGSGKTTLLNKLLRAENMQGTAVLVNELGQIGIDHDLVVGASDDILLLDGGCLCCRPQGSITEGISRFLHLDSLPNTIVIETSGAANPYPIMENLSQYSHKIAKLRDPSVITTLDSTTYLKTFSQFPESRFQVSASDFIILTKTDIAPNFCRDAVEEDIRRINPRAIILDNWEIDATNEFVEKLRSSSFEPPLKTGDESQAGTEVHGEKDFQTVDKQFYGYLNAEKVQDWIDKTLFEYGSNLLRVKGILHLKEFQNPVTLQCVRDHVFPITEIENQLIKPGCNTITAIGWDMHRELISEAINDLSIMAHG